jgi:hypothetical protein
MRDTPGRTHGSGLAHRSLQIRVGRARSSVQCAAARLLGRHGGGTSVEQTSVIEAALRRDRLVVASGLALVTLAAWAWTLAAAVPTGSSGEMGMADNIGSVTMAVATWSPPHAALVLTMWWVMMAAMMLPSASGTRARAPGWSTPPSEPGLRACVRLRECVAHGGCHCSHVQQSQGSATVRRCFA